MDMNGIVVAGASDAFPENCCQNCGLEVPGFRIGHYLPKVCSGCGVYPGWMSGKTTREKRLEVLTCDDCGCRFLRRVTYTTTDERCGDRERTRVARFGAWSKCGACAEMAQARHYDRQAANARHRANEKRASQKRAMDRNDAHAAKVRDHDKKLARGTR